MEPQKKSKVIKWSLIVGIVVVLNLFFNYTLSLVYNAPEYENFCKNEKQVKPVIADEAQCVAVGGQWNPNTGYYDQKAPVPTVYTEPQPKGSCYENFTCEKNYQDTLKVYEKNVFITLVVLGVISIVAGIFITGVEVLSVSLSLGGVLSFIVASIRYWSLADRFLKVGILAVALIALIWLAVKKFKD